MVISAVFVHHLCIHKMHGKWARIKTREPFESLKINLTKCLSCCKFTSFLCQNFEMTDSPNFYPIRILCNMVLCCISTISRS